MTSTNNDENRLPLGNAIESSDTPVNPYMRKNKKNHAPQSAISEKVDKTSTSHHSNQDTIVSEPQEDPTGNGSDTPLDENGAATIDERRSGMKLLLHLQRDYEASQKNSVRACLRSKAFPCPEVSYVLEQYPDLDLLKLQGSYQTLLENEEYLGPIIGQKFKFQSTLWSMARLGTAIRFLQLLVVSKNLESQATAKMISELLRKLCFRIELGFTIDGAEDDHEEEEDNDLYSGKIRQHFYPPQIACFALSFLIKIRAKILELRPSILPPWWRSIDTIAVSLSPKVPSQLLQDSVEGLSDVLKEFLQISLSLLGQFQQRESTSSQQQPLHPQQFKMMSFILTRLESFLKIASDCNDGLDEELVQKTLSLLLCFRGLPAIGQTGLTTEDLQKLALKAAKCVTPILLKECHCGNDGSSNQREVILTPQFANLKQLCDMAVSSAEPLPSWLALGRDPNAKTSISIGKVQVLRQILQQLVSTSSAPRLFMDEKNVNIILSLCEHVLFVALPICYNLLFTPFLRELLDKNLHCISDALHLIATTAPCMTNKSGGGPTALHRLLLRWLMMPLRRSGHHQNAAGSKQHHHPLTRELLIACAHFHVVRLHKATATTATTCSPECLTLLDLLVKALMDHRTTTCSRRTIATLMRDILLASSSSSQSVINALQRLVCANYATKRPLARRKKRKRGKERRSNKPGVPTKLLRTWQHFTFEDLEIIGSVLALIPLSILPNAAADVEWFCVMELDRSIQQSNPKRRMQRRHVVRTILNTALLMAAAQESPATDNIQKVTGGLEISALQLQICHWFITLWNLEFHNGKRNHIDSKRMNQLVALGIATIRFLVMSCEIKAKSARKKTKVADIETMRSLYTVFDLCTSGNLLNSLGETCDSVASVEHLVLEAVGGIDVLARTIPLANVEDVAKGFATIFHRTFSAQRCWSLHAHTVGPLSGFFRAFDKTQLRTMNLLANCLPKHGRKGIQALLECRVTEGGLYKYEQHKRKDNTDNRRNKEVTRLGTVDLMQHCSSQLESLMSPLPLSSRAGLPRLLPIEVGSYFVEMPTLEGRKVTVVFPPQENSLRDIRYMLEGYSQDDENQQGYGICQLKALRPVQDGSCVALLRSLEAL